MVRSFRDFVKVALQEGRRELESASNTFLRHGGVSKQENEKERRKGRKPLYYLPVSTTNR